MTEHDAVAIPTDAVCLGCGYRLRGLGDPICPECGRSFDPDDATTFGPGTTSRFWQRCARPPTAIDCWFLAGLCSYALVTASGASRRSSDLDILPILMLPLWAGAIAMYLVRFTASLREALRATAPPQSRKHRWRWMVMPLCVLLPVSSFLYPWPLMLRFRLSQEAFDTAVKDYRAGSFTRRRWVGLYYVKGAYTTARGSQSTMVCFATEQNASGGDIGLEYDPLPGHAMDPKDVEVAPSWYTFED